MVKLAQGIVVCPAAKDIETFSQVDRIRHHDRQQPAGLKVLAHCIQDVPRVVGQMFDHRDQGDDVEMLLGERDRVIAIRLKMKLDAFALREI